ncbi:hypothetical protein EQV77_04980 [Halobacillus fulvus]|nr:hypothetical protein EQV77_04980 [Halobacillus fulvus]
MQPCQHCGQRFSWKQVYYSTWAGYTPVTCSNCGTVHDITSASKVWVTVLFVLPIPIIGSIIMHSTSIRFGQMLLSVFVVGLILMHVLPFFLRYTYRGQKEEANE